MFHASEFPLAPGAPAVRLSPDRHFQNFFADDEWPDQLNDAVLLDFAAKRSITSKRTLTSVAEINSTSSTLPARKPEICTVVPG